MPEYDRQWWYEHCKEHQEKLAEEYKKASHVAKAPRGKRPRKR